MATLPGRSANKPLAWSGFDLACLARIDGLFAPSRGAADGLPLQEGGSQSARPGGAAFGWTAIAAARRMSSVVYIIDDDASLREALKRTFRSVGLEAVAFGSATEFLQNARLDLVSCLILDVRLPGPSGLDFQAELAKADISIPIIFITGHGDIPMSVKAMKAGAVEFLTKPVRDQDLLDAVRIALDRDRTRREHDNSVAGLRDRLASLTAREREIIGLVTAGMMNKQIAGELGLSEITVKVHRGNLMKKMGARSVAELVRMADVLNIGRVPS